MDGTTEFNAPFKCKSFSHTVMMKGQRGAKGDVL